MLDAFVDFVRFLVRLRAVGIVVLLVPATLLAVAVDAFVVDVRRAERRRNISTD